MNLPTRMRTLLVIVIAGVTSAGCGIDQGGVTEPDPSIQAVTKPLIAVGTVQAPDPLTVNGIVLDTSVASVSLDGAAATPADLRAGQVVSVVGTIANGNAAALSIVYEEDLRGVISAIDSASGIITVLAQPVKVDNSQSVAANVDLASLVVGDSVEISGFGHPDGTLLATYIDILPAGASEEIVGVASLVDTAAQQFSLGNLRVDYSAASVINNLPMGEPQNGLPIEVEGNEAGSGIFAALRLQGVAGLPASLISAQLGEAAAQLSVTPGEPSVLLATGFADGVTGAGFTLGEVAVQLDSTTAYDSGNAANLVDGALIRLEASVDAGGVVVAIRILFL